MRTRLLTDDRGVSATELIVVTILLGIILAATWSVMTATSNMTSRLSARAEASDEAQVFLDQISLELRQADNLKSLAGTSTSNADAQGAVAAIGDRTLTLYADLYHNGKAQKVQYVMVGQSLVRKEWTATNNTYPYTWPGTPNKQKVVIAEVDANWVEPIFTYYANDDWPPTEITSESQVASVTAALVQVKNVKSSGGHDISVGTSSTVRIRAIGNKF